MSKLYESKTPVSLKGWFDKIPMLILSFNSSMFVPTNSTVVFPFVYNYYSPQI